MNVISYQLRKFFTEVPASLTLHQRKFWQKVSVRGSGSTDA